MKKYVLLLLGLLLLSAVLTGCSEKGPDLVTKEAFPTFNEVDTEGNEISNDIFAEYDVTIVNFWNNGCGTCIAEMPELEEMYQQFKEQNINLIGVGADSGESDEHLATSKEILSSKGVTYRNISPDPENDFYKEFISQIGGYPTTYIVDSKGNMVGAPIIGNVKNQEEALQKRLDSILKAD